MIKIKILKILSMAIFIIAISINSYAKYNYNVKLNAYNFTRDNSQIMYKVTKSNEEYTNKDIILNLDFNKPIGNVDGYAISENRQNLNKIVTENEMKSFWVEDDSGNKTEVKYEVNNIDKIPPQIIGVENGNTYSKNQIIGYEDNIGIKDIFVDRYTSLNFTMYTDYYDTAFYKGIDVLSNSLNVNVYGHPKGTVCYAYYLNNILKAKTTNDTFKFEGLVPNTNYTVKICALDENDNIIESSSRAVKTKYYTNVTAEKRNDGTFKVTVYGIDTKIQKLIAVGFTNNDNRKNYYPQINSDRSATFTFSAKDITGTVNNGYYYFHIQMFDSNYTKLYDTLCCNVIFGTTFIKESNENIIDPRNLTLAGNYQIIVTDLAGNKTEKNIVIK